MRVSFGLSTRCALGALVLAVPAVPATLFAQTLGYDTGSGSDAGSALDSGGTSPSGKVGHSSRRKFEVTPYIEVDQVVTAQLSPGDDVLTYTQLSAGVDAAISGRNTAIAVSARYARQIGWGKTRDADLVSGVARASTLITPGLSLDAGALATQMDYSGSGTRGSDRQTYSVYGGPAVKTQVGKLDVAGSYRLGYTRIDQNNAYQASADSDPVDVIYDSVIQSADLQAGFAPGTIAPVGLGVGGSFYQEDMSAYDQRVRDMQARAMVTVPVNRTTRVVGAIGYEDVEISNRDVLYDGDGNAVVGSDGQYVTDKSSPRQLSYDVSGILWDVAVMWRPSPRTSLSAHFGRRYGSTSFGGTLAYSPDDRKHLGITVYDNVAGFGGQVNNALASLSDDFEAVRDPVTGELSGCVDTLAGSNCLTGVLGAVRSSAFRARGVAASYTMQIGRLRAGLGLGYDRRRYLGAEDTILASANGTVDENYWITAYLSGPLGRRAGWSTTAYANWIVSNYAAQSDVSAFGASAAYYRLITPRLRGSVALSLYGVSYDEISLDDIWSASALAGLRYNF
ncbi:preprotein translocase subunit YajC [Novosphingobium sp. 1949]|uniref:Preprotein translocase subunit YajC n=1 Tax=Novosphingobium organovorum TaxID=2930092 RepID=A0ABT0B9G0_9SPHN|nr:preprotein translocase subunit YajC [Novosphingobium organovorum]MCJ2181663.1 preprotein translocase subunit YajC [Novosphingobium organovorum]